MVEADKRIHEVIDREQREREARHRSDVAKAKEAIGREVRRAEGAEARAEKAEMEAQALKAKLDKARREFDELRKANGHEMIDVQEAHEKEIGNMLAEMCSLEQANARLQHQVGLLQD